MTALYLELQLFMYPAVATDLLKQLAHHRFNQEVDLHSAAFLLPMFNWAAAHMVEQAPLVQVEQVG